MLLYTEAAAVAAASTAGRVNLRDLCCCMGLSAASGSQNHMLICLSERTLLLATVGLLGTKTGDISGKRPMATILFIELQCKASFTRRTEMEFHWSVIRQSVHNN